MPNPTYPILELWLTYAKDGKITEWLVPSCAFHDLLSEDDVHLAGMGLACLGNLVKLLGRDLYDAALGVKLLLKRYPTDPGEELPFPGMPGSEPVPLDLTQMPFEAAMFLEERPTAHSSVMTPESEKIFRKRVDRLALMARIQVTWVPYLKARMLYAHA